MNPDLATIADMIRDYAESHGLEHSHVLVELTIALCDLDNPEPQTDRIMSEDANSFYSAWNTSGTG